MLHMGDLLLQAYDNLEAVVKRHEDAYRLFQGSLAQRRPNEDLKRSLDVIGLDFQAAEEAFNEAVRRWIRQTGHFPDLAEDMLNYLNERGFVAYNLKTLHTNYKVFPIEMDVVPVKQ